MYKKPICSSFDEQEILLQKIRDKANKEFDSLISSFDINKEQNKEWAEKYYCLVKECKKLDKSIKAMKVWRWILIIFIFPFILMTKSIKKKTPIFIQKCSDRDDVQKELTKQLAVFSQNLSYEFTYEKIINEVWQDIKLKPYLDPTDAGNWEFDYHSYMFKDSCATALVSGRLFDHPFVYMNRKDQRWHPHVYTGTLPVTYTTTVNGKTETRTQVVVATVTLPEPDWNTYPYFIYKTSKPLDLDFDNNISKKDVKKAIKKAQFQAMDNPEFDKVFPANRNNEVDFRVVFTPVAQEAMINLFKTKPFAISKRGENTSIGAGLSIMDNDFSDDFNYDLTEWKNKYVDWVIRLCQQLTTYSLPIANMPVYTQMSYKDHSASSISNLQIQEYTAWLFKYMKLYDGFETDVIFEPAKFSTKEIEGIKFNCVEVKCNSFHPHHRVQMEPRPSMAGPVLVPVHVIDYLPRTKSIYIFESINFDTNKKEIYGNEYCIHSGKLIFASFNPQPNKSLIDQIKKIKK